MAHRYWPESNAIGPLVRVPVLKADPPYTQAVPESDGWLQIIGVVADARNDRRAMMLLFYGVMLLAYAAMNVVTAHPAIALASIAAAVAGGATSPLMESVTIRLAERYGFDYGRVRLWCSTLFVVGNVVSGLAVQRYGLIVIAMAPEMTKPMGITLNR